MLPKSVLDQSRQTSGDTNSILRIWNETDRGFHKLRMISLLYEYILESLETIYTPPHPRRSL